MSRYMHALNVYDFLDHSIVLINTHTTASHKLLCTVMEYLGQVVCQVITPCLQVELCINLLPGD